MSSTDAGLWRSLESQSTTLFLAAGTLSLVAAANYGIAWLVDSVSFNAWVGLTVLFARVASLLGVAGLTVRIVDRGRSVGRLSRVMVALALLVTIGLMTSAILGNLGVDVPGTAVLGLGTFLLSVITYSLFGAAILRTGAHGALVGALLLGAALALLFGMFGRAALPLGAVGTVAELALVVTHVGLWQRVLAEPATGDGADLTPQTAAE